MFQKSDYIEYFKKIKAIEDEMVRFTHELKIEIKGDEAQKLIAKHHQDELKHVKLAEKMITLVSENMKS